MTIGICSRDDGKEAIGPLGGGQFEVAMDGIGGELDGANAPLGLAHASRPMYMCI